MSDSNLQDSRLTPHASRLDVVTHSPAQTGSLGKRLGRLLKGGEIIGLTGELGSGKTSFTRGVAEGAGVGKEAWIRSPTFTLINEYDGRLPMYHIDLYRIDNARELEELNLREYLFSDGASVIEWFEHLPAGEVDEWLQINFEHAGLSERRLTFTAYGQLYEELLKGLKV